MKTVKLIAVVLLLAALTACAAKPEALYTAIKNKNLDKVRNIVDLNKDLINHKQKNGGTPLHEAVYTGDIKFVKALVERGAKVNVKKNNGYTPLHIAAMKGYSDIALYLIDKGANRKAKDDLGQTPGELAEKAGHKSLVRKIGK